MYPHIKNILQYQELQSLQILVSDDARQFVAPMKGSCEESVNNECGYIDNYYKRVLMPLGYRLFYTAIFDAFGFKNVEVWVPRLHFLCLLCVIGFLGSNLSGSAYVFAAVILLCFNNSVTSDIVQNIPRSYAYLGMLLIALALQRQSFLLLLFFSVLMVSVYPIVGVIGFASAIWLCLVLALRRHRALFFTFKDDINLLRRSFIYVITICIAMAITVPQWLSGNMYGQKVGIKDYASYPEADRNGRYGYGDYGPFTWKSYLVPQIKTNVAAHLSENVESVFSHSVPLVQNLPSKTWKIYLFYLLYALALICSVFSPIKFSYLGFLPVSILLYFVAVTVFPIMYFPFRYLNASLTIAGILFFPHLVQILCDSFLNNRNVSRLFFMVFITMMIFFTSAQNSSSPYSFYWQNSNLKNLPSNYKCFDHFYAGWPSGRIDSFPYVTGCKAMATFETLQAFHLKFIARMRTRVKGVIDVFFDNTDQALRRLYEQFHVTHFFVEYDLKDVEALRLFEPYQQYINGKLLNQSGEAFIYSNNWEKYIEYRGENFNIINLKKYFEEREY